MPPPLVTNMKAALAYHSMLMLYRPPPCHP
nr:MAG TPA: hypothetical protein [Caudoviricetes sp.]